MWLCKIKNFEFCGLRKTIPVLPHSSAKTLFPSKSVENWENLASENNQGKN